MAEEVQEIMSVEPEEGYVDQYNGGNQLIACTFDVSTDEGRAKAYNAAIVADARVEDVLDTDIDMDSFMLEQIAVVNEDTGEVEPRIHSIIFDADGTSYESQSKGIASSLMRLDGLYHFATRKEPLRIQFTARKARLGRMFVIRVME